MPKRKFRIEGPRPTFHVGEKVVYPNQGVGTIENIGARAFGVQTEHYYLVRVPSNSLTVMVPFSHVQKIGLRKITRSREVAEVLTFLATGKLRRCSDWKNRLKGNSERMRNSQLLGVAEVLKCLLIEQQTKPLSFREKNMLDRARAMLITELSITRSISEDEATVMLQQALAKSSLIMPRSSSR